MRGNLELSPAATSRKEVIAHKCHVFFKMMSSEIGARDLEKDCLDRNSGFTTSWKVTLGKSLLCASVSVFVK